MGNELQNPWFHLLKPLVLQGETMGFATHFPDFSSLKRLIFTHDNSNKYSLTPLSQILNDL